MTWADLLLAPGSARRSWEEIFTLISEICRSSHDLDVGQWLNSGDQLLATAAWDLWRDYDEHAPKAIDQLLEWWTIPHGSAGRAVLVLDSFSVREMRYLLQAADSHGITPHAVLVRGSEIPSDTESFAHALGLSQRSQLKKSSYPSRFRLATDGLFTDVTDGFEFGQLTTWVPPERDLVLWLPWLDDIIHANADKSTGARHVATVAKKVVESDEFWQLLNVLRQGRDLLLIADHGYAISQHFVELPGQLGQNMRAAFGASRCGLIPNPTTMSSLTMVGKQPLVVVSDNRAAVTGPWKWKVQGGFPQLSHGGLTLAEISVPVITFPAC